VLSWFVRALDLQSLAGAAQRTAAQPARGSIRSIAVRPLAHGTLPGKQTYTIIGERYLFQQRVYLAI
jgi:hypothetical protein